MTETYKDLDELWCLWGDTTSAVMRHIKDNESIDSEAGWVFVEGVVRTATGGSSGHTLSIINTGFDRSSNLQLFLSVHAVEDSTGRITVTTTRRCELTEELEQYL